MSAVNSMMMDLGTPLPNFELPAPDEGVVSTKDFPDAKGLLVMFICNHCPYVKHVREELVSLVKEYQAKGIASIAVNANDWTTYPDDSPEMMAEAAREYGYTFPYVYDETQEVAKSFEAACTPDFFLFDSRHLLFYRGQMDGSRPGNAVPVTGEDLRAAMDALLKGDKAKLPQRPSLGCNIKWRKGNEPEYF